MKRLTLFIFLSCSVVSKGYADPNITYQSVSPPPGSGFDKISWSITPQVVPDGIDKSYYWANQISSHSGHHALYTGLQPRLKSDNLVLFSVFGSGTSSLADSCRGGADGGSGTSCSITYPWKVNHSYRLDIERSSLPNDPAQQVVMGYLVDSAAKKRILIGKIAIPSAWGGLEGGYLFNEFFPFNSASKDPQKRECIPYSKYTTSLPTFYSQGIAHPVKAVVKNIRFNAGKDHCSLRFGKNNNQLTTLSDGRYQIETGILSGVGH